MHTKVYYVYIMANAWNTTFYVGVTNNLERRVWQYKTGNTNGFVAHYHLTKLVYYEEYPTAREAIHREKQLKNWRRDWKINLVRQQNPDFKDLAGAWFDNGDAETSSA